MGSALLHITTPGDWAAAAAEGWYRLSTRGRTLEEEGFIHCSEGPQAETVANKFYGDLDELLLLVIDPKGIDAEIRYESPPGSDELYPHIYGPFPVSAVRATVAWRPTSDGLFRLPDIITQL
jgi:uncharacterized protein (DUF952 family)